MKINKVGNVCFAFGGIATIVTLEYKWFFLGLLFWFIGLIVWVWNDSPSGGSSTSIESQHTTKKEFSDHFIYYNLFDKHKGGK